MSLIDLGSAPFSNAYLTKQKLQAPEKWFPLRVLVCENCWMVQTEDFADPRELFNADYAYFSSVSATWLAQCGRYVDEMGQRLALSTKSYVVEVAANDGHLLQYVKARGIPCVGIEPAASAAKAARAKGIEIIEKFFDLKLAKKLANEGKRADLMVANNILAHVPDINNFVAGFAALLKPQGVATFEFPHLLKLIEGNQFDTLYHEHFSYLSLTVVKHVFEQNGLSIFDVEELATHGGSLRVHAQRSDSKEHETTGRVNALLALETAAGVTRPDFYANFQAKVDRVKNDFLWFLLEARKAGKTVAAYGAAAKGNTLLNYAGIRADLLPYVVDKNSNKQEKYLPGSRIPIVAESVLKENRPDFVVILPWNLKDEVMEQLAYIREWGGMFVMAIPRLVIM
jgi:2-polyprenyl-3-methyl-5-hydroxy-6-metoxy-1,4-benzoquinol methylase